ncbi:hypothetical protein [Micromonospora carbonacea]|uniref:hypothetical protein n=1 Tax=Micromonospora carbonacea TaxID=47853 RepID=UPI003714DC48
MLRLVLAGLVTAPVGATLAGLAGHTYGMPPVAWGAASVFSVAAAVGWRTLRGVDPGSPR